MSEETRPTVVAEAPPAFAHASEAEFARILDFYAVDWHYEPHTFPILWSLDGSVVESFTPDFYLPDLDLYIELTTLKQKLVRKKNRKLRRLRELYPDVRIKLFYARDFRMLMLKFGRLGLIDELTGASGQVAHPTEHHDEAPTVVATADATRAVDLAERSDRPAALAAPPAPGIVDLPVAPEPAPVAPDAVSAAVTAGTRTRRSPRRRRRRPVT